MLNHGDEPPFPLQAAGCHKTPGRNSDQTGQRSLVTGYSITSPGKAMNNVSGQALRLFEPHSHQGRTFFQTFPEWLCLIAKTANTSNPGPHNQLYI